ncbi:uncharacterized protein ACN427_006184 isoform 1-T5 [Glossina fuscipes fuscipes]
MHFYRWCLLQAAFYIGLVAIAYASRREVGQHLAEVNQPNAETLLQPIKFGLKTATKQSKPEDISTFNYIRNGTFAKNSSILPINQTIKPFNSTRPGIDEKFIQQLDIPTKGTSTGHQQHLQLQLKQNQHQHQPEKRKQRSRTSSEYKITNPMQLNMQPKEIHRQAIIPITKKAIRATSSAYQQQKSLTTQFPPSSSSFSSLFSAAAAAATTTKTTQHNVNSGNNNSIAVGNKSPKNYNNNKDNKSLQLSNAIQLETFPISNGTTTKSSMLRHNSRSIVRKSSARGKPAQATAFGAQFSLPLSFNIFSPEFWQFFIQPSSQSLQTAATTRKPPKKYRPTTSPINSSALTRVSTKEEKLNYQKPKTTNSNANKSIIYSVKGNNTTVEGTTKRNEEPFRIAVPTVNRLSSKRDTEINPDKDKRETETKLREKFNCPRENEVRFQLFPKICKIDNDCKVWNRDELCCEIFGAKSCVSGIPKPLQEAPHAPILGLIPRKCPSRPLAELWWEVEECETDTDCWPRICCPDGRKRYCRTSQPELDTVPESVQRSFNYLTDYLECTPPPPPIFDLHPKVCTSTLDCFPNVCCQEAGLRHCRPPKKSVFTMLANVFNVDFVKRLTQNIVIK